ncbi:MAG: FlgD immunoglobulin-like domain containing protein [Candidatus Krumholzibacteriota bacterium]
MISGYSPDQFQAFAIDVWDGGDLNAQIFIANSQINYPYLMYGGIAGIMTAYNCFYDIVFVIGGDGIILYRGEYSDAVVQTAIDQGIADLDAPSAVGDTPVAEHRLLDGYPNPFNPRTRIPYELGGEAGTARVNLQILDLRGRVVKTLVDGVQNVGQRYEAVWNGTDEAGRRLPSGAYMSRLTVGGQSQARMLTLVK